VHALVWLKVGVAAQHAMEYHEMCWNSVWCMRSHSHDTPDMFVAVGSSEAPEKQSEPKPHRTQALSRPPSDVYGSLPGILREAVKPDTGVRARRGMQGSDWR
jgi:hypothetical protein